MATWKLVPDTGQISGGPHSSMPLVVIPSEIEIGAITLAEAQSSRYYTDSGLVTEVAREVVSSDELHFDGSSVSSSSEYWMDFDGVRSDYAVTDTYGRNAVWGDYLGVYHMNDATDSTGSFDGTASNVTFGTTGAKVGSAGEFNGSSSGINLPNLGISGSTARTIQAWVYPDDTALRTPISQGDTGTSLGRWLMHTMFGADNDFFVDKNAAATRTINGSPLTTGAWHLYTAQYDGGSYNSSTSRILLDSVDVTDSVTNKPELTTQNLNYAIGYDRPFNTRHFDGKIDEVRWRTDSLSANWITTEYKSQYNNAAFWVATDVSGGGGGGGWVGYPMIHMLQFNCVM